MLNNNTISEKKCPGEACSCKCHYPPFKAPIPCEECQSPSVSEQKESCVCRCHNLPWDVECYCDLGSPNKEVCPAHCSPQPLQEEEIDYNSASWKDGYETGQAEEMLAKCEPCLPQSLKVSDSLPLQEIQGTEKQGAWKDHELSLIVNQGIEPFIRKEIDKYELMNRIEKEMSQAIAKEKQRTVQSIFEQLEFYGWNSSNTQTFGIEGHRYTEIKDKHLKNK